MTATTRTHATVADIAAKMFLKHQTTKQMQKNYSLQVLIAQNLHNHKKLVWKLLLLQDNCTAYVA